MISTIGAFLFAAGVALFVFDLIRRFRPGQGPSNPWRAGTLKKFYRALNEQVRTLVGSNPKATTAIVDSQSVRSAEQGVGLGDEDVTVGQLIEGMI